MFPFLIEKEKVAKRGKRKSTSVEEVAEIATQDILVLKPSNKASSNQASSSSRASAKSTRKPATLQMTTVDSPEVQKTKSELRSILKQLRNQV
jgi:hypothetical protein